MSAQLNRGEFAHTRSAFDREWLVTNGLGGFASGTVAQANTRRYHGLLIAALRPPVERTLLVAKVDVTARYGADTFNLGCNEFTDGTLTPRGFELLSDFRLDQGIPVWTYALRDAALEQRIWMQHGQNTAYLSLTLKHAARPIAIELTPLCTYRDYHGHTHGGWTLEVTTNETGCTVRAFADARPYRLCIDRGQFQYAPDWYWRFWHREEAARGLDATEDLFRPGVMHGQLRAGETLTFVATAELEAAQPAVALAGEIQRRRSLLRTLTDAPTWIQRLTLAADAFLVQRCGSSGTRGALPDAGEPGMAPQRGASPRATVISGYPWFSDWGRDTMIALPGLTLATGRAGEAASILRTFASHVSQGMLPNRFPDAGVTPEYNTADATLWYFHALDAYLDATDDRRLVAELYPVLKEVIHWHRRGTRYGIQVDPADGLLRVGEPGVQLTWMDAKIGDWVVTPRTGKPVEINALWYLALENVARWAEMLGDDAAAVDYRRAAGGVAAVFAPAFWYEGGGYLYDVIDCEGDKTSNGSPRVDASLRPNQILAVSLGGGLLDSRRERSVVDACARELLTPVGLRSLAPGDTRYARHYRGDPRARDAAYHQGTVWSWLLGPFALAHYRVYGDAAHALGIVAELGAHLNEACIGTISEIFDGDAPHVPRGCFAQAWSVGETLRAWHVLARAGSARELPLSHAGGQG